MNIWYGYEKQLAKNKDFVLLEKQYIDYTKEVSELDAVNEMNSVDQKIAKYNSAIQRFIGRNSTYDKRKAQCINTYQSVSGNDQRAIAEYEGVLSKYESALEKCKSISIIGLVILILGVIFLSMGVSSEGTAVRFFWGINGGRRVLWCRSLKIKAIWRLSLMSKISMILIHCLLMKVRWRVSQLQLKLPQTSTGS